MEYPIDRLTDRELEAANRRFKWVTATRDSRGRILGRGAVFDFPERRVRIAQERLGFAGKSVVEFGCLEGAHTVALCRLAKSVVAIEGKGFNAEKARYRCALYGATPEIVVADVEKSLPPPADLYFHSGVLYHLVDPIGHLLDIMPRAKEIFLDTHHATNANVSYVCPKNEKKYACRLDPEPNTAAKAGLQTFARWVRLGDIVATLKTRFAEVEVVRDEKERHGPRASIVARKRL